MTTLLVDADIVAYKFAAAAEENFCFDDEQPLQILDNFDHVCVQVDEYLGDLMQKLGGTKLILALSCPSEENFRLSVLPSYKENRKDIKRPIYLKSVREWLTRQYPKAIYQRPTLEGDDVMGILATSKVIPGKKIVVSEDKDLKQIPGWLYNPRKDDKPHLVTKDEGDYYFFTQVLTGDPTDNYKGCPGIGKVRAEKILEQARSDFSSPILDEFKDVAWKAIVATYESKGLTEEDALVQARVARICQASDYDFKGRKVILWSPKNVS
jgi:DNA polymerase-1